MTAHVFYDHLTYTGAKAVTGRYVSKLWCFFQIMQHLFDAKATLRYCNWTRDLSYSIIFDLKKKNNFIVKLGQMWMRLIYFIVNNLKTTQKTSQENRFQMLWRILLNAAKTVNSLLIKHDKHWLFVLTEPSYSSHAEEEILCCRETLGSPQTRKNNYETQNQPISSKLHSVLLNIHIVCHFTLLVKNYICTGCLETWCHPSA